MPRGMIGRPTCGVSDVLAPLSPMSLGRLSHALLLCVLNSHPHLHATVLQPPLSCLASEFNDSSTLAERGAMTPTLFLRVS
jgi:hypothetical protein